jgi:hypothetical protein
MNTYDIGDRITVTATVRVASTLTDATVSVSLRSPSGTTTAPSVTHVSQGVYTFTMDASAAGTWRYVVTGTGAAIFGSGPQYFFVRSN